MHTLEELLFQLSLCNLDLDGLVHLLGVSALVVCVVLDGGREKGVDEGRLSKAGFTSNHNRESGSSLGYNLVALVGLRIAASLAYVLRTWGKGGGIECSVRDSQFR